MLKIKKEVVEISQSVGVKQGDNMAPVLFLFLKSAFAKTLKNKWRNENIEVCTVRSVVGSSLAAGEGQIRSHRPKEYLSQQLTAVEYSNACVSMMALSFFPTGETWLEDLRSSTSTLPDLASKCMLAKRGHHQRRSVCFPPPPCFFNSNLPLSITNSIECCDDDSALTYGNNAITDNNYQREDNVRQRREKEEVLYGALEETKPIDIKDSCVIFYQHFKYLGFYISFGLTNNYDIEQRLNHLSNPIHGRTEKHMGQLASEDLEQISPVPCNSHELTSLGLQKHGPCGSHYSTNWECSSTGIFAGSYKF